MIAIIYYIIVKLTIIAYIFKKNGDKMQEKIKHYAKETLLFFVLLTLIANVLSLYKSSDVNKEPLKMDSITLIKNQNYQLPHAKPILIHFWASWCPTCSLEASNIQKISEHYETITIAVKSGSDAEIQQFLQERNLNFQVANDANGIYANSFKIAAFPTTLIYDKEKNLVFSEVGYTSTLGLYLRMWWSSL